MAQEKEQSPVHDIDNGLVGIGLNGSADKAKIKVSPLQIAVGAAILGLLVILTLVWWLLGVAGLVALAVIVVAAVGGVFYRNARRDKRAAEAAEQAEREAAEAAEQERLEAEEAARARALIEERNVRHDHMVDLRNQRRKAMAVFVGNQAGSGGKTTTCAYMSLTFRRRLKAVPVIIVECRRDSAQGVDIHRLDNEKVVTIRQFHQKLKDGELNNPDGSLSNELIMEQLMFSSNGIYYLQADVLTPMDDSFDGDAAAEVVKTLKTTGAIIIIDSGNDPSDEITIGMADECTLGVFPTMPTAKSFTMWRRTLDTFNLHVTSDIVKNSVSVLSAVEDGQDFDLLKSKMGTLPGDGSFFFTRFDPYMKDDVVSTEENDGTKVADLDRIMTENRDAFERICERLLEMFVMQGNTPTRKPIELRPAARSQS